ncbi:unnamed protein product [Pylaiella littoralis]
MIIPVSIDKAAETAARGGASEEDGQMTTIETKEGVCVPEWSMVELQGELVCKDPLSGQPLGSMTSENGKPVLVISNHKLEGKTASEPKPLLVLRKVMVEVNQKSDSSSSNGEKCRRGGSRGDTSEGGGEDQVGAGDSQPQQQLKRVEYRVVGKVTRKTIFKTRPKPLIRKLGGSGPGGGSTARSCM